LCETLVSQPVARSHPLQQRVAAAIVDAAARVLAARGEQASMQDVAAAAGVGRATVYRYFPSRQALLDDLARMAVGDASARLSSARIDAVDPEEGVARAVRALVEVGDPFLVVARERVRPEPAEFERRLAEPLRGLLERGQTAGVIRDDIPSSWLTESLFALVVGVVAARPSLGREDTIAAITSVFLDGARPRMSRPRGAG
jgi:TetR/AcrR family transcriptional regulator, mexCD-oprJ operon repressor